MLIKVEAIVREEKFEEVKGRPASDRGKRHHRVPGHGVRHAEGL